MCAAERAYPLVTSRRTAGLIRFYTGDSAYSIAWLQMDNRSAADAQFDIAFSHMDLAHFNVWREKNFSDGEGTHLKCCI